MVFILKKSVSTALISSQADNRIHLLTYQDGSNHPSTEHYDHDDDANDDDDHHDNHHNEQAYHSNHIIANEGASNT